MNMTKMKKLLKTYKGQGKKSSWINKSQTSATKNLSQASTIT